MTNREKRFVGGVCFGLGLCGMLFGGFGWFDAALMTIGVVALHKYWND